MYSDDTELRPSSPPLERYSIDYASARDALHRLQHQQQPVISGWNHQVVMNTTLPTLPALPTVQHMGPAMSRDALATVQIARTTSLEPGHSPISTTVWNQPAAFEFAGRGVGEVRRDLFHQNIDQNIDFSIPSQLNLDQTVLPTQRPVTHQLHRVQMIHCAHCDNFLTDRGMRAVLLLKPSFTLYSTDAQPLNCGPVPFSAVEYSRIITSERTCECLTQSLGCFGCGWTIGYHIISPCRKCTRSVAKHERSANGHRFVFHFGEVVASDRLYQPGELGVQFQQDYSPVKIILAGARTTQTDVLPDPSAHSIARRDSIKEPFSLRYSSPQAYATRSLPPLAEGDVVYWHHLKTSGERAKPVDPHTIPPRRPVCER